MAAHSPSAPCCLIHNTLANLAQSHACLPPKSPLQELHAVNPCAGKKDGTILPSAGCSPTYFQCWRGKPVSPNPKCAAPLVFNPKASPAGCSYVGAVGVTGCNCAAAYKGEQATACTVCQVRLVLGEAVPCTPCRTLLAAGLLPGPPPATTARGSIWGPSPAKWPSCLRTPCTQGMWCPA